MTFTESRRRTALNGRHCLTIIHNIIAVITRRRGHRGRLYVYLPATAFVSAAAASSVSTSAQPPQPRRTCVDFDQTRNCLTLIMKWPGRRKVERPLCEWRRTTGELITTCTGRRRCAAGPRARTVRRMHTRRPGPSRVRLLSGPVSSLIETDDIMSRPAIFRQSCAPPLPPVTASARNFTTTTTTTTRPDNDFCPRFLVVCVCA